MFFSEFLVRRDGDPLGIKRQMLISYTYTYTCIHAESSVDKGNKEKIASKEVDKDEGYPSNSISTTEAKNRGTEFVIGLLRINVFTGFVE